MKRITAGILIVTGTALGACTSGLSTNAPRSSAVPTVTQPMTTLTPAPETAPPPPSTEATTSTAIPVPGDASGFPSDWVTPHLEWFGCGSYQCADIVVPIDWSAPSGPTLALRLTKDPATSKRQGALLVNPGGPGVAGSSLLSGNTFRGGALGPALRGFDIVAWDPRGTGDSERIDCDVDFAAFLALDSAPDDPEEQRILDQAGQEIATRCAERAGPLIAHVSVADTVLDLEAIRRAIDGQPLNYYGFSYGTAIGSWYAERFPTNIRTMVLDGAVDPTNDLRGFLAQQTIGFQNAIDQVFRECGGLDPCPLTDVQAAYDEIAAELESRPARSGSGSTFGPAHLASAAVSMTYYADRGDDFVQGLAAAQQGDFGLLADAPSPYSDLSFFDSYLATVCIDQPHPVGASDWQRFAQELKALSPRWGEAVANEVLPCAFWTVAPTHSPGPVHAAGAAPIVVVGTTGDSATPYVQAQELAAALESGHLITLRQSGHTAYGDRCIEALIGPYIASQTVPAADASC